jgi:hypothetical protein
MQNAVLNFVVTGVGTDGILAAAALCNITSTTGYVRQYAKAARQQAEVVYSTMPVLYGSRSGASSSSSSSGKSSSSGTHPQLSQSGQQAASRIGQLLKPQPERLDQWMRVAQLSRDDAHQVLAQHPSLQSYLNSGDFMQCTSYYMVNVASLSLHPAQLVAKRYAAMRGILALVPPGVLYALLEQELQPQLDLQQRQQHEQQQEQEQHQHQQQQDQQQRWQQVQQHWSYFNCGPADLQLRLSGTLGPVRPQQQQGAADLRWPHQLQQRQPVSAHQSLPPATGSRHSPQHVRCDVVSYGSLHSVAEAVVAALGLSATHSPAANTKLHRLLIKAAGGVAVDRSCSPPKSSCLDSVQRAYSTQARPVTVTAGLSSALEAAAQTRQLRRKPVHSSAFAEEWVGQLQHIAGFDSEQVLQLLLCRPAMLWQHHTPTLPAQVLSDLQRLVPELARQENLSQLVLRQPGLLSCSSDHLHAVVDMLRSRLQLDQAEAAQVLQQHPRILVQPVKQMLPSIGFLVGLGLSASDLRVIATKNPKWLTRPLRSLMSQWQFIQQALKVREASRCPGAVPVLRAPLQLGVGYAVGTIKQHHCEP